MIDTDYNQYSVVYTCSSIKQYLYFLTREPVIEQSLYDKMMEIARVNLPNFNFDKLAPRDYQGEKCTYETA